MTLRLPCLAAPVYPRECGGTLDLPKSMTPSEGLSPRVRGNQDVTPPQGYAVGSIPASAGEPIVIGGQDG